jgi:hypothetical protein
MNRKDSQKETRFLIRIWRECLIVMAFGLFLGCAPRHAPVVAQPPVIDSGWTMRSLGHQELEELAERDPDLSPRACLEILARLNQKGRSYIQEDIGQGRVLKVPNDFRAYLTWTPMPRRITQVSEHPKLILVAKDLPFLGWYERGVLAGDAHVCIGKKPAWTKSGLYRVKEKDADHVSGSYRNAYGGPALMPYAIRIYERVWIHGGDITGGYCSHGCINLPLDEAEKLFQWADQGTLVLIVESLENLHQAIAKHSGLLGKAPALEGGKTGRQGDAGSGIPSARRLIREGLSALCSTAQTPPHRGR